MPSLHIVAFGLPLTLDQMPQRMSVRAALAIRHQVAESTPNEAAQSWAPEVRLAVHVGEMLADVSDATSAVRSATHHALANPSLGNVYQAQGDYRRAIDCFGQTVAFLDGARRRERFGQLILPAVFSRAWLACVPCRAGHVR